MIELFRSILVFSALALMGGGYLASQYAAHFGNAVSYGSAVDSSAVRMLALLILVGGIVVGITPLKSGDPEKPS